MTNRINTFRKQTDRRNNDGVIGGLNQSRLRYKTIVGILAIAATAYVISVVNVVVRVHQLDSVDNKFPGENNNDLRAGVKRKTVEHNQNKLDGTAEVKKSHHDAYDAQIVETKKRLKEMETKLEIKGDKPKIKRPNFIPNPHGHGVEAEILVQGNEEQNPSSGHQHNNIPEDQILTAYVELSNRSTWNSKPLPVRDVKADDLIRIPFPKLNSCSRLPEQLPVDNYPDADPFLPWIHDVFPTNDGKWIQFVAQNKRRCHTGNSVDQEAILDHTAPQSSLFQHIPLVKLNNSTAETPRYRLCSHEEADLESVSTRFICRFKPSGDITFSTFNIDYEWSAMRKRQAVMFHENGRDNGFIHTSQLIFKCPVPDHLIEKVRNGSSVVDDWATIFVDLIPIRTPPRYGPPDEFLSPFYSASMKKQSRSSFDPHKEWGGNHILPEIEDSGRWENFPVCKPSLMTYEPQALEKPKHHLVSCLWASTGYTTRGNRYAINDGQRRLLEWITFNKILGFDHFYIYDNSGAFTNQSSLQPIADIFPDDVTLINWPSRVCNNNPNNVDR